MRGVKRASKIRKLFNLSKEDDVRDYVKTYKYVRMVVMGCLCENCFAHHDAHTGAHGRSTVKSEAAAPRSSDW